MKTSGKCFIITIVLEEDKEDLYNKENEEKPILIPNQDILAQKPIAEALLSELLIKIESLKLQGILFWGMETWEDLLIVQQDGDSAFIEQQYDVSANRYREALQMLSDMEVSIPDVLTNALKLGQTSILAGNKNDAIANFEIALAIDGNNLDAKQGLDRALKLDQVLERTQRGQTEFGMGSYERAIESFEDALSIDPNWQAAIDGLAQSKKSYADELFQESLSKGYQSLKDESFDDAKSELFNIIAQENPINNQNIEEVQQFLAQLLSY